MQVIANRCSIIIVFQASIHFMNLVRDLIQQHIEHVIEHGIIRQSIHSIGRTELLVQQLYRTRKEIISAITKSLSFEKDKT